MSERTSKRKNDHIHLTMEREVETGQTGFKDVKLIHEALPELHKDEIDLSLKIVGHELDSPLLIESMTGGSERATEINRNLATAAQEANIAMGVGSQRAGLEDESLKESYAVVREVASDAFIFGNLGAPQLHKYGIEEFERAVEMVDADAMAIHLNFMQESIQPEGDIDARDCLNEIKKIAEELSVPLIVKETGCGISKGTAEKLTEAGVDVIDVGGKGGTSWPFIESYRASAVDNERKKKLGKLFQDWGIPTAASTFLASEVHPHVISSGGIRSGLDAAKAMALGAKAVGLAKPFLEPALQGGEEVVRSIERIKSELRTTMFVTGSRNLEELRSSKTVVTGRTKDYIDSLRD